ncbi:MAG: FmdB family zinc ribbon protein [Gemmatimonadota bacterium]
MPIYEYTCRKCGAAFELLVRKGKTLACSACGSEDLERHFSLPAVKSESTHALAMRAARKRDQTQAVDRVEAQRAYERNHDD